MPAPYGRRDWQMRADRALGRTARGQQQGRFAGARPVVGNPVGQKPAADQFSSVLGKLHHAESPKPEGEAPQDSYTLRYKPTDQPYWPRVFSGGALQHEGLDYTISGRQLTVLTEMDLQTNERLFCHYDYLAGAPYQSGDPASYVGIQTNAVGVQGNTVTVDSPATTVGQLIMVLCNAGGAGTITGTGWTVLGTPHGFGGSFGATLTILTLQATNAEIGATLTFDPAGTIGRYAVAAVALNATTVTASAFQNSAGGVTSLTGPTLSMTHDDQYVLEVFASVTDSLGAVTALSFAAGPTPRGTDAAGSHGILVGESVYTGNIAGTITTARQAFSTQTAGMVGVQLALTE